MSTGLKWYDTARAPRFFVVEARAAAPLVLWAMHMRWWTFYLALVTMVIFMVLERYRITVPIALRAVRSFLAGRRRPALPWMRQGRFFD